MQPDSPTLLRRHFTRFARARSLAQVLLAATVVAGCGTGGHVAATAPRAMPEVVGESLPVAQAALRADGVTVRGFTLTVSSGSTSDGGGLGPPPLTSATVCSTRPGAGTRLTGTVYLAAAYSCN